MIVAAAFAAAAFAVAQSPVHAAPPVDRLVEVFEDGCIQPLREGGSVQAAATRLGLTSLDSAEPNPSVLETLTGVRLSGWRVVVSPALTVNLIHQSDTFFARSPSRIESCAFWMGGREARVAAAAIEARLTRSTAFADARDMSTEDVSWREYGSGPETLAFVSYPKSNDGRVYVTVARSTKREAAPGR